MKAGNFTYAKPRDIPSVVPVFPLSGALLLPGARLPLNVFEPRYLSMVDDALAGDRLIAMIQPKDPEDEESPWYDMGCLGRISAFQESGDGRYLIHLSGICRYRVVAEEEGVKGYRRCRISAFEEDLAEEEDGSQVDRETLLATFRKFIEANDMETDWDSIDKTSTESLVTALCMASPYGPAEKQALLEASDLKARAETLVAITEIALARGDHALQ